MHEQQLNMVYDLLVSIGGAYEDDRDSFVYAHLKTKYPCTEWRFQGHLGFGGKYRILSNRADYYSEDKTSERDIILKKINEELSKILIP